MPARCSDLPITRSIKSLIPEIQASYSTREEHVKRRTRSGGKMAGAFFFFMPFSLSLVNSAEVVYVGGGEGAGYGSSCLIRGLPGNS